MNFWQGPQRTMRWPSEKMHHEVTMSYSLDSHLGPWVIWCLRCKVTTFPFVVNKYLLGDTQPMKAQNSKIAYYSQSLD